MLYYEVVPGKYNLKKLRLSRSLCTTSVTLTMYSAYKSDQNPGFCGIGLVRFASITVCGIGKRVSLCVIFSPPKKL